LLLLDYKLFSDSSMVRWPEPAWCFRGASGAEQRDVFRFDNDLPRMACCPLATAGFGFWGTRTPREMPAASARTWHDSSARGARQPCEGNVVRCRRFVGRTRKDRLASAGMPWLQISSESASYKLYYVTYEICNQGIPAEARRAFRVLPTNLRH